MPQVGETPWRKGKDFPCDLQKCILSHQQSVTWMLCFGDEKASSPLESQKHWKGSFLHASATNRADLFHDISVEVQEIGRRADANLHLNTIKSVKENKNRCFSLKVGDEFF